MGTLVVKLVGLALKLPLSIKAKNKLTIHILESLHAVPLRDIITQSDTGEISIKGRELDIEGARKLQTQARYAQTNQALNLIREQVKYEAFVGSATKAGIPEDLLFYRAALWFGQREEYFLRLLAGSEEPTL